MLGLHCVERVTSFIAARGRPSDNPLQRAALIRQGKGTTHTHIRRAEELAKSVKRWGWVPLTSMYCISICNDVLHAWLDCSYFVWRYWIKTGWEVFASILLHMTTAICWLFFFFLRQMKDKNSNFDNRNHKGLSIYREGVDDRNQIEWLSWLQPSNEHH